MSIHAMNVVWQSFPRGGSEKLALLALADWCDDEGLSLHPSIATLARKISASTSQARRIVHGFIKEGLLEVIGNHYGGAKGDSRHYRLRVERIATASASATPRTDATPSTGARDGWHPCTLPLAPMLAKPPLTIIEPPEEPSSAEKASQGKLKGGRRGVKEETLSEFLNRCKTEGVKPILADDPIFDYIGKVGLSEVMLEICWFVFKDRYASQAKGQKDWRATFRNAVKGNWYRLWFIGADGATGLTTAGQQAQREMDALAAEADL